jgi:hypothetical protein
MKPTMFAFAILIYSASAMASSPAAFIPAPQNCMVLQYRSILGMTFKTGLLDEGCMQRQEVRTALEYCADQPQDCTRSLVMIGDVPLVTEYPKHDSAFFESVSYSYGLREDLK